MQPIYYHTLQQATSATTNGIPSPSMHTSAPAPSAQESKQRFQDALKALLVPSALTGDTAVRGIVSALNSFGAQDVDAATRLEVVTKIRDNAGNTFFRAWADNTDAMDIFREWLKAGATGKDDGIWEETIMPLLHVSNILISRVFLQVFTPMTGYRPATPDDRTTQDVEAWENHHEVDERTSISG